MADVLGHGLDLARDFDARLLHHLQPEPDAVEQQPVAQVLHALGSVVGAGQALKQHVERLFLVRGSGVHPAQRRAKGAQHVDALLPRRLREQALEGVPVAGVGDDNDALVNVVAQKHGARPHFFA